MKKEEDIFELIDELESINASKGVISKNINYYLRNKARETGIPYHGRFELTPFAHSYIINTFFLSFVIFFFN